MCHLFVHLFLVTPQGSLGPSNGKGFEPVGSRVGSSVKIAEQGTKSKPAISPVASEEPSECRRKIQSYRCSRRPQKNSNFRLRILVRACFATTSSSSSSSSSSSPQTWILFMDLFEAKQKQFSAGKKSWSISAKIQLEKEVHLPVFFHDLALGLSNWIMVTIREMRCLFPTDYWFSEKILMFFSEKMLNDVCQCLLIFFPGESSQDDIYFPDFPISYS